MDIATEVAIISAIVTATTFVVKKIVGSVKHEALQGSTIINLQDEIDVMKKEIKELKCSDKDRELAVITIKEKMENLVNAHETTQTMISNLTEMQQETFKEMLKTINAISNK